MKNNSISVETLKEFADQIGKNYFTFIDTLYIDFTNNIKLKDTLFYTEKINFQKDQDVNNADFL